MVAGNVIIGRREEGEGKDGRGEYEVVGERRRSGESDGEGREGEEVLVGGLGESVDLEELERRRKAEDVLDLDGDGDGARRQEARDDLQLL